VYRPWRHYCIDSARTFNNKLRRENVECLDHAQELACLIEFWELFFFGAKLLRVNTPPAAVESNRVLQMEHLVKQYVFNCVTRHSWLIKNAADDDGVVRRIVVSEAAAGMVLTPGKLRTSKESVEKAAVEVFENFIKMVVMTAWGANLFPSAHLADQAGFGRNVVTGNISSITAAVGAVDGLAIELGQQDVSDRVQHSFGRALEQVGEANEELSIAEADGVVDGNEGIETKVHGRCRHARAKFAIGFVKDFGEFWRHVE
jgi:hypothetical protein